MPYKYTVNDSNVSYTLSHPKFLQLPNFFPDGNLPCLSVRILQDQLLNSVILNGPYPQCILILSLPGSSVLWSFYCAFKDTTLCRDLLLTFKSTVVLAGQRGGCAHVKWKNKEQVAKCFMEGISGWIIFFCQLDFQLSLNLGSSSARESSLIQSRSMQQCWTIVSSPH